MPSASSPSLPLPTSALSRINTALARPWGHQKKEQARREHGCHQGPGLGIEASQQPEGEEWPWDIYLKSTINTQQ